MGDQLPAASGTSSRQPPGSFEEKTKSDAPAVGSPKGAATAGLGDARKVRTREAGSPAAESRRSFPPTGTSAAPAGVPTNTIPISSQPAELLMLRAWHRRPATVKANRRLVWCGRPALARAAGMAGKPGPGPIAPVHRITIWTAFLGALAYLAFEAAQIARGAESASWLRAVAAALGVIA